MFKPLESASGAYHQQTWRLSDTPVTSCLAVAFQLEWRRVVPPYVPPLSGEIDLEYFDPMFTSEPVQLTPSDP